MAPPPPPMAPPCAVRLMALAVGGVLLLPLPLPLPPLPMAVHVLRPLHAPPCMLMCAIHQYSGGVLDRKRVDTCRAQATGSHMGTQSTCCGMCIRKSACKRKGPDGNRSRPRPALLGLHVIRSPSQTGTRLASASPAACYMHLHLACKQIPHMPCDHASHPKGDPAPRSRARWHAKDMRSLQWIARQGRVLQRLTLQTKLSKKWPTCTCMTSAATSVMNSHG